MCVVGSVVVVGSWGASAAATQPLIVSFQLDRTFVSPFYSAACGFEVSITYAGVSKGSLYYDRTGAILRELDAQPSATITVSSTASGRSFSFPLEAVYQYQYPNGTSPGASATVTAFGLSDKVPGIPSSAGALTYGNATVLFVDGTSGFPIVDFGPPTSVSGHWNGPAAVIAAGCAALSP